MSPLLVLVVAVLATTYAGPVVRFAAAPALAVSFWRLALVLPVTLLLGRREPATERGRGRRDVALMALSGLFLAAHFWTWIASLRYTSVASSVLLVNLRPIFVWAIAALWLGEHPGRRERLGFALAVAGVASGTALTGFSGRDWAVFTALAAGPMLVGHTGMNYALKHLRATTVNVAGLGEPVGATLIAWLVPAIHEVPAPSALGGGALALGGIALSLAGSGPAGTEERGRAG